MRGQLLAEARRNKSRTTAGAAETWARGWRWSPNDAIKTIAPCACPANSKQLAEANGPAGLVRRGHILHGVWSVGRGEVVP